MKRTFIILSVLIMFSCAYVWGQVKDISKVGPKTENMDLDKYDNIYYVSISNGSAKTGDGSKANPWNSISFALKNIIDNSENNRIALLISEGKYAEGTLQMKQFVDMFGGYDAVSWNRDIYDNKTILDGEYSCRLIIGADNARLDGFKITKGIARSAGGGVLCDDTSPEISNCFIEDNYTLEPENFNNERIHQHGNEGGGIACFYNATPVIRNNVFYKNRTSIGDGGALSFYGWTRERHGTDRRIENNFMEGSGRPEVRNNVFIENYAGVNDNNESRSSNGGALSCSNEARPIIENNVFADNYTNGNSDAGAIYVEEFSYPTVNGNWIVGNIANDDGGGMYIMRMSHAVITDNFIAGNRTENGGAGGIRLSKEGRATISNNIIVQNKTGGGIQAVDGYMILKNNVIMDNRGSLSIKCSNIFSYFQPSVIEDNIIRDNEGKIVINSVYEGQVIIKNNNISNGEYNKDNFNKTVKLGEDEIVGKIVRTSFDPNTYQAIIDIEESLVDEKVEGRIINIGDYWGVIIKMENKKLTVWGNVNWRSSDEKKFTIISDYKE